MEKLDQSSFHHLIQCLGRESKPGRLGRRWDLYQRASWRDVNMTIQNLQSILHYMSEEKCKLYEFSNFPFFT
jgi:hypothetical protein